MSEESAAVETQETESSMGGVDAAKVAAKGVKSYLSDWKNWLTHGLIGVAFLVLAIWAPIEVWIKLIIIACVIAFNVVRMRLSKKRKEEKAAAISAEVATESSQN